MQGGGGWEAHKASGGGTSFSQAVRIEVIQLQSWGSAGLRSHSRELVFIYSLDHSLIYSFCVCIGMGVGVCMGFGFMYATAQACACVWKPEDSLGCHSSSGLSTLLV